MPTFRARCLILLVTLSLSGQTLTMPTSGNCEHAQDSSTVTGDHHHHAVNASDQTNAAADQSDNLLIGCDCGCDCVDTCIDGGLVATFDINTPTEDHNLATVENRAPSANQLASHPQRLLRPPTTLC